MEQEETQELDNRVLRVPVLLPGDRCRVELTGQSEVPTGDGDQAKKPVEGKAKTGLAQVKFVGQVPGMPKGYWVGVQYDDRIGKNDGMLNGRRYFRCPAGYGGFVRSTKLTKIEPQASAGKEAVASEVSPGSMASRIAKRRQERSMSGRSMGQLTLDEWHARVAPTREEGQATPDMTCATGPELDKAVVGTLSQFTILARNSSSEQVPKGGDIIEVTMRGLGGAQKSQPALMHNKITDRDDGSYICEFRPSLTGTYGVWITLDGCNISGSPYELSVITLRPAAERCVVRGDALRDSIARTPMKFEVLFVDAKGCPTFAEDLDVYVERTGDLDSSFVGTGEAPLASDASPAVAPAAADSTAEPNTEVAAPSANPAPPAADSSQDAAGLESSVPVDYPRQSHATFEDAFGSAPVVRSHSPRRSGRGTPRRMTSLSPHAHVARAIESAGYRMLEAPVRQRHMSLWSSRQTADKWLARTDPRTKGAPMSFVHELSVDPLGFAFGGVDPGTLHAHGKIVKIHSVHYSVGLSGKYKLHVGLRHQMCPLPGSPFELSVEPSKAYAASTKLPADVLPLSGVASEEVQHGLRFTTADMLGNRCRKGGSNIVMQISKGARGDAESSVHCEVVDNGDGIYELKWRSIKAGVFPIDVLMDGSHVMGSPTELQVRSAMPAVEKMAVSGIGISKAVAGNEAELHVRVADRYGNEFEAGNEHFPYSFGLILNPFGSDKTNDKADKKKQAKVNEKMDSSKAMGMKQDEKKAPSLPFTIDLTPSNVFQIRYVAQTAGAMDLHVWAQVQDRDERVPLPGSPFQVFVSEGKADADGSFVAEAEASKQGAGFSAGENVILKPQIRDAFGNPSTPAEGLLTAEHVKPGIAGVEELPPPTLKGGVGSYEVHIEPVKSGTHNVYIKLDGVNISGSPVSFNVDPAAPSSNKCKVERSVPPEQEPIMEKQPIHIIVTLYDKYGNQLDHGGVRVDAKASGIGVSGAKVEDNKDGTYTISLVAGPPGEIKVAVRIDGNDLPPYNLVVQKNPNKEDASAGAVGDGAEQT